jgi:hypothetical protein
MWLALALASIGQLSFGSPISTALSSRPVDMVMADLNGDGKPDLITFETDQYSTPFGVSVLLGNGNGTFGNPRGFPLNIPDTPKVLAVGDVNGDGKLDIVTANISINSDPNPSYYYSISVALGDGRGYFSAPQTSHTRVTSTFLYDPTSVVVSDLNGTGMPEIIVGGQGWVDVWGSNRKGTSLSEVAEFVSTPYVAASHTTNLAVGDVNGDGRPDIVATDNNYNLVEVLLNTGFNQFSAPQPFNVGGSPSAVAVGDVNGDGKLDIVTANGPNSTVSVLLGNGNGTFGTPQTYAVAGTPNSIALGDFNGNGRLDIVTAGTELEVLPNNGGGTFGAAQAVGPAGSSVAVADVNADGLPDIAQIDGSGTSIDVILDTSPVPIGGKKHR